METKTCKFELKSIAEDGSFCGYLAVFGNTDDGGDVAERGCCKRTLQHWEGKGGRIPLTHFHDLENPTGWFTGQEDDKGLFINGQFLLDIQQAREDHIRMKAGVMNSLSIGYKTLQKEYKGSVRHLKEIRLIEGSTITTGAGMNPEASVIMVKAAAIVTEGKSLFTATLAHEAQEQRVRDQRWKYESALSEAMETAMDDETLDNAAKLESIRLSLGDYGAAMLRWAEAKISMEASTPAAGGPPMAGIKAGAGGMETKAGRMLSAANRQTIPRAMQALQAILMAADKASDSGTSDPGAASKAAGPGAERKDRGIDPESLHSMQALLAELKTSISR